MTLAEKYLKKVTEEVDYDLDQEIVERLENEKIELEQSLAWDKSGKDWKRVKSTIVDFYKNIAEKEIILKFNDSSYLKVKVWDSQGLADDELEFILVEPYQETVTKYREI